MIKPRGTPRKLTAPQVRYIRKASALRERLSTQSLADRFGVSVNVVCSIASGRHKGYSQL